LQDVDVHHDRYARAQLGFFAQVTRCDIVARARSRCRESSYRRSKFAGFRRTFPSHPHVVFVQRKRQIAVTNKLATRSSGRRLMRRAKAPHLGHITGARSLKVETI